MKVWIAAALMLAAAGASAQAARPPAVSHTVAEVARTSAHQPYSVMLGEDQLVVLIVGLDGQEKRAASLDTAASKRRGTIAIVGRGVSTTLEVSPGPKGYASVKYAMDVEESGLAHLTSSRPETSAAQIINAFTDFWINAPRTFCPKEHIERCLPLNFPL